MLAFSMGHFATAEPMFQSLLAHWPDADFCGWARRCLCILMLELGRPDDAAEVAAGFESRLSLPPMTSAIRDSPHRFMKSWMNGMASWNASSACAAIFLTAHRIGRKNDLPSRNAATLQQH